jgi:phage shock protein C
MFCTRCGVQLDDEAAFCSKCGTVTGRGTPPVVQKRLVRKESGKKIAGVCSGISDYLDVDPIIVRLVWVLLTFGLPPAGVLGYIVAWMIIPKEPIPVAFSNVSMQPQS